MGFRRACARQKSASIDILVEVGPMDAPSRVDEAPVSPLLVRAVRESRVDLHRNAYRLAVFEIYVETLVDDAHVFHAVPRIEIRRLRYRGGIGLAWHDVGIWRSGLIPNVPLNLVGRTNFLRAGRGKV